MQICFSKTASSLRRPHSTVLRRGPAFPPLRGGYYKPPRVVSLPSSFLLLFSPVFPLVWLEYGSPTVLLCSAVSRGVIAFSGGDEGRWERKLRHKTIFFSTALPFPPPPPQTLLPWSPAVERERGERDLTKVLEGVCTFSPSPPSPAGLLLSC